MKAKLTGPIRDIFSFTNETVDNIQRKNKKKKDAKFVEDRLDNLLKDLKRTLNG